MKAADGPTTTEVARALDVDGHRLRVFAEAIAEPTPATILGWAEAAPRHRELVEAWLERVERETNGRRVANGQKRGERV